MRVKVAFQINAKRQYFAQKLVDIFPIRKNCNIRRRLIISLANGVMKAIVYFIDAAWIECRIW